MTLNYIYIFSPIVLFILLILFAVLLNSAKARKLFSASLNLKLLLIKFPQKQTNNQDPQAFLREINESSQLITLLSNSETPFSLEVAVGGLGEDINFYLAIPEKLIDSFSRSIQGMWPDVEITKPGDYNVFNPDGASEGMYLVQKEPFALPIRTFAELNIDTFLPILSNFSRLSGTGEGMAMQVLVNPAPKWTSKSVSSSIQSLKKGAKLSDALGGKMELSKLVVSSSKDKDEPKIVDDLAVKALEQKISKPLFSVNVRLVASAKDQIRAKALIDSLANSFGQFYGSHKNDFKFVRISNPEKFTKIIFRQFDESQRMILSSDEISSIFHFPTSSTNIPKINWLRARESEAPLNLPTEGLFLGTSVFGGESKPAYITYEDRRRHIYMVGQTGTGKSSLINNLAIDDIRKGKGVAVIDPHGDLIESLMSLIPEERMKDVIVFDPGDIERPLGLNMFEYDVSHPEQKTFIVNELLGILDKLYDMKTVGGPMFEQYLRNATLLLLDDAVNEPATLMELPRVFTDSEFRARKLARISNPTVIDFWEKQATKMTGETALANMTGYVVSKFNAFTGNDFIRPIISQTKSAFNFREVMDSQKILLVNLSKGRIGDINANLLGMIVVGKILMAALSRVDIQNENERKDFNLYIDEFQNFTTDSIAIILSEARKYRLNLVIAHQFIAQLVEKIRDAVFGNVGSIIAFRVGASDAEFLVKQFEPVFSQNDLINIDNLNAYIRMLIGGQPSKPFNIKTGFRENGKPEVRDMVKAYSRETYGRDRAEVETETLLRLRG